MLPAAAGVEPQAVNTMAQVSPIEADYGREEQKVGNWLPVQHGAAGNGVGLAGGSSGSLPVGNGMGGLGNGPVVTSNPALQMASLPVTPATSLLSQPIPHQNPVQSADKTDHSVQNSPADGSAQMAEHSVSTVTDFNDFKRNRLNAQSGTADPSVEPFDKKKWKRSRLRPGWLIKRLTGYQPVEDEYGCQYLGVVSRKPDRMSADRSIFPFAGFLTWESMMESDLLVTEVNVHESTRAIA